MISRRNRRKLLNSDSHRPLPKLSKELSPDNRQRAMLGYSVAEAMVYPSNSVRIFNDGGEMFNTMFSDISSAKNTSTYNSISFPTTISDRNSPTYS